MSSEDPKPAPEGATAKPDRTARSGEGAATALEAMLRKRKMAETPDTPDLTDPDAPAPSTP